jgi:cell division protein ZapA (FtsZ GTPase activity inhibitor)
MNEKVDIEIFKRKLTLEMEGLTPIEINALAQRVHEKMIEISEHNNKIADSSKLAILAALNFAAELYQIKEARETEMRALDHKVEELNHSLRTALSASAGKK